MRVVVDTNVALSALAAGCGDLAIRLLSPAEMVFCAPRFLFIELFKHKARLVAATKLPEEKLLEALHELIESLQLIEAASIPVGIWMQARRLCEWRGLERHALRRARLAPRRASLDRR